MRGATAARASGCPMPTAWSNCMAAQFTLQSIVGRGTTVTVNLPPERLLGVGHHLSMREAG